MVHFVFHILDDASALEKAASSAHPAGALTHLGSHSPTGAPATSGRMRTRRPYCRAQTRDLRRAAGQQGQCCRNQLPVQPAESHRRNFAIPIRAAGRTI